jgi:hypothetical protein
MASTGQDGADAYRKGGYRHPQVSAVAHRVADDGARSVPSLSDPADRADAARLLWVALQLRDEWLGVGLSTLPADRAAAEQAVSGLYQLTGRPPPRFRWFASPACPFRDRRSDGRRRLDVRPYR